MYEVRRNQKDRLFDCLNRFVKDTDKQYTDADFIEIVHRRWLGSRTEYIGDVGDGVLLDREDQVLISLKQKV
jgi:hypothetical protein